MPLRIFLDGQMNAFLLAFEFASARSRSTCKYRIATVTCLKRWVAVARWAGWVVPRSRNGTYILPATEQAPPSDGAWMSRGFPGKRLGSVVGVPLGIGTGTGAKARARLILPLS